MSLDLAINREGRKRFEVHDTKYCRSAVEIVSEEEEYRLKCECPYLLVNGIPCSHAIKVLRLLNSERCEDLALAMVFERWVDKGYAKEYKECKQAFK